MIRLAAAAALLLAGGTSAEGEGSGRPGHALGLEAAQLIIRERIVIRVPEGDRRVVQAGATLIQWRESNGPRCVPARDIIGATLGQSSVDLIMRNNIRMRARLAQRCAGLDYYRGFYVNATTDGRICADRDAIRSRMGVECGITAFRQLQPVSRR